MTSANNTLATSCQEPEIAPVHFIAFQTNLPELIAEAIAKGVSPEDIDFSRVSYQPHRKSPVLNDQQFNELLASLRKGIILSLTGKQLTPEQGQIVKQLGEELGEPMKTQIHCVVLVRVPKKSS